MNLLILRLAWRNIWRNRRRTIITLAAMVIGMGVMVWMITFFDGFHDHFIKSQLKYGLGSVQIHLEGYQEDKDIEQVIRDPGPIMDVVREIPGVEAAGVRLNTFGLISHGNTSQSGMIIGTDPAAEIDLSVFPEKVGSGEWLPETIEDETRLPIVIGVGLAKKLDVDIGDRLFLMVQGLTGDIGYTVYFVHGIFASGIGEMDKSIVYVPIDTLRDVMAADIEAFQGAVHEITLQVAPQVDLFELVALIETGVSGHPENLEVLNWRQMQPGLVQAIEMDDYFLYIMMIFVFILVAAGIMNTFLMGVFERTREFGIFMSLGSRPSSIFKLILTESSIIGIIGAALGLGFGLLGYWINTIYPWNFGSYEDMGDLMAFDWTEDIYPALIWSNVMRAVIGIYVFTLLAAIYPAIKAALLKPVEALRHV